MVSVFFTVVVAALAFAGALAVFSAFAGASAAAERRVATTVLVGAAVPFSKASRTTALGEYIALRLSFLVG